MNMVVGGITSANRKTRYKLSDMTDMYAELA